MYALFSSIINMDDSKWSKHNKHNKHNSDVTTKQHEEKRRLVIASPFAPKHSISYGLIVFAMDSKRWAIVRRKHTVEFTLFIRGTYRPTFLPIYLGCITKSEATTINNCLNSNGGEEYFQEIFLKELGLAPEGLIYALKRLQESRIITQQLLASLDLSDNELEWVFPNGRVSLPDKSPLLSAQRQFVEEIGVELPPALFISGDYVSETIKTLTNRILECRYWIYIVPQEFSIEDDASAKQWSDNDICRHLISNKTLFEQVASLVDSIQ